jgi:hypothetical protein
LSGGVTNGLVSCQRDILPAFNTVFDRYVGAAGEPGHHCSRRLLTIVVRDDNGVSELAVRDLTVELFQYSLQKRRTFECADAHGYVVFHSFAGLFGKKSMKLFEGRLFPRP